MSLCISARLFSHEGNPQRTTQPSVWWWASPLASSEWTPDHPGSADNPSSPSAWSGHLVLRQRVCSEYIFKHYFHQRTSSECDRQCLHLFSFQQRRPQTSGSTHSLLGLVFLPADKWFHVVLHLAGMVLTKSGGEITHLHVLTVPAGVLRIEIQAPLHVLERRSPGQLSARRDKVPAVAALSSDFEISVWHAVLAWRWKNRRQLPVPSNLKSSALLRLLLL